MKNALILHGTSSTPNDYWFPYLRHQLEIRGYQVTIPQLPQPEKPDLQIQLPFVLNQYNFNSETLLIGHSAGASLVLGILDAIQVKIYQTIMVAGFLVLPSKQPDPIVKPADEYNWLKMRTNSGHMTIINSTDDPWGLNELVGQEIFSHIGDRLIIHHEGHMGSTKFNQPYTEFPLLVKLIELAETI